jgi:DNA segregation ATPase FtsK/SpoIIIE-like protein
MNEAKELITQLEADAEERATQAEKFVRESGRASISALQRHFKICYGNACRLMDQLVLRKVVSQIDHEGRRTILEKVTP